MMFQKDFVIVEIELGQLCNGYGRTPSTSWMETHQYKPFKIAMKGEEEDAYGRR